MWIQYAKKKQLQEDITTNQISIKEYVDPFEKEEKEKEKNKKMLRANHQFYWWL